MKILMTIAMLGAIAASAAVVGSSPAVKDIDQRERAALKALDDELKAVNDKINPQVQALNDQIKQLRDQQRQAHDDFKAKKRAARVDFEDQREQLMEQLQAGSSARRAEMFKQLLAIDDETDLQIKTLEDQEKKDHDALRQKYQDKKKALRDAAAARKKDIEQALKGQK